MNNKVLRQKRIYKRKRLMMKRKAKRIFVTQVAIIIILLFISAIVNVNRKNENPKAENKAGSNASIVHESNDTQDYQVTTEVELEDSTKNEQTYPIFIYDKNWDYDDSYMLAKIAMAEAEGCSTKTKSFVILCVLNRVVSDEFPNSIYEVIFQENQFTPISDGRWYDVEPNQDCWRALEMVKTAEYDYSEGCLYFESCEGESWHSRNLEFLYKNDTIRFYK